MGDIVDVCVWHGCEGDGDGESDGLGWTVYDSNFLRFV
jgi:hypothetical protein